MLNIYTHIPRTGGTTLQALAMQQYSPHEIVRVYGAAIADPRPVMGEKRDWGGIKWLTGHNSYGIGKYLPPGVSCQYVTLLRDPIARVLSAYEYIRRSPSHHLHKDAREMDIGTFASCGITTELDNGMVRQISGICGELPQWAWPEAQVPMGKVTQEICDHAMVNLRDAYTIVGVMERYEESISLFARELGWKVADVPKLNTSGNERRAKISDEAMGVLLKRNMLDQQLYEYGCALLDAAL